MRTARVRARAGERELQFYGVAQRAGESRQRHWHRQGWHLANRSRKALSMLAKSSGECTRSLVSTPYHAGRCNLLCDSLKLHWWWGISLSIKLLWFNISSTWNCQDWFTGLWLVIVTWSRILTNKLPSSSMCMTESTHLLVSLVIMTEFDLSWSLPGRCVELLKRISDLSNIKIQEYHESLRYQMLSW